jgi:hypothetical protein
MKVWIKPIGSDMQCVDSVKPGSSTTRTLSAATGTSASLAKLKADTDSYAEVRLGVLFDRFPCFEHNSRSQSLPIPRFAVQPVPRKRND